MRFLLLPYFLFFYIPIFAQIAINTDSTDPAPSAMLDIKSSDKGLLIPRMTATARDAINSPATGLLIYNNNTNSFNYFNGIEWISFINENDAQLSQITNYYYADESDFVRSERPTIVELEKFKDNNNVSSGDHIIYCAEYIGFEEKAILADNLSYSAFPGFCIAPNGDFLIAYYKGTGHISQNGEISLVRSTDRGKTWSAPQTIIDGACDDRDVTMTIINGEIVLNYFETCWNTSQSCVYFSKSTDNGLTWSDRIAISKPQGIGNLYTSGEILVADNGNWLLPVYGRPGASGGFSVYTAYSTDTGTTWNFAPINANGQNLTEMTLHKTTGGIITGIIRNNSNRVYKTTSSDDGLTWTDAVNTNITDYRGTRPTVFQYPDGKFLLISRDNTLNDGAINGDMSWWLSNNEGTSWGAMTNFKLPMPGAFMYADVIFVNANTIGVTYSIEDTDIPSISRLYYGEISLPECWEFVYRGGNSFLTVQQGGTK